LARGRRRRRCQSSPYLGFVYPPNDEIRIAHTGGDFGFTYTTDEHGFRNPSPWPERADVVVLGDSMAFGYGVNDGEAWTTLLANQLSDSRVINSGLIGAAAQQYLRIYERFGQALRPDLIVFCLFPGNDLRDAELFDEWLHAGSPGNYRLWRQRENGGFLEQSHLMTFLHYARNRAESAFNNKTLDFADGGQIQLAPTMPVTNPWRSPITRTSVWCWMPWNRPGPWQNSTTATFWFL
jgi:hypothetical protein